LLIADPQPVQDASVPDPVRRFAPEPLGFVIDEHGGLDLIAVQLAAVVLA
jgi:hypothetical protein